MKLPKAPGSYSHVLFPNGVHIIRQHYNRMVEAQAGLELDIDISSPDTVQVYYTAPGLSGASTFRDTRGLTVRADNEFSPPEEKIVPARGYKPILFLTLLAKKGKQACT